MKVLKLFILFLFSIHHSHAAVETIAAGSYIINMGVSPQTVNNGLRPYGMVYDLVKNYKVPIKWVIKPGKAKDAIDFSHNGVDYRGGPFIIPAAYRTTAVNARITYWTGQGVVGATTVSNINVDVYTTLRAMPRWTLDDQNGSIAQTYINNAQIPATAYNWLAPAQLTCCDDIFAMPHADPVWSTHANLFPWNLNCDGAIWMACHAGSALEDLFNPSLKSQQMNFLSNKTGNATGSGPYEENALVLWGNHSAGSPPYNYAYHDDPIMQFLGTIDIATQNGSEQIYLPKVSWRAGARVYVWDPTQADVPSKSPGPAAVMVSGRGFDDPNRGRVMLEAAHSHAKSTAPANVAAQRAFFNFAYMAANEKAVIPDLSLVPDTMYSGVGTTFSFTLPPGYNAANYTILWSSSCGGTFTPNNAQTTTFVPPTLPFPTTCYVSVSITDACGRTFIDNRPVIVGCNLLVNATTTSPSCFGGSNGSISMSIQNGNPTYNWNWSRISPVGSGMGMGTTISSLTSGTYNVTVTASGGCSKTFSVSISQPTQVSATATPSPALCFGSSTGSVSLSVSGGTPTYTYLWSSGETSQNISGKSTGSYTVTVTDSKGCTRTASATVTQPTDMVVTPTPTHVLCYGESTGAISLSVSGGTGSKTYLWSNGASTQNISGIAAGSYTVTVTDANGCTKTASSTVIQPSAALNLSATQNNVACNGQSNGSIDLSVSGGTSGYSYVWSTGATSQDISGLAAGTYTVTVTDANACSAILSRTITQPAVLSLSNTKVNATCPQFSDGSIDLTVNGGTPPYFYDWADVAGPLNSEDRTMLAVGTYMVTVTDSKGCSANTSISISNILPYPPQPPVINNN